MGFDDKNYEDQLEKELDEFMGQQYGPVSDDPSSEYFGGDEDDDDMEDEDDLYESRKKRTKKIMIVTGAIFAVLFLAAASVFGFSAYYYSDKFLPGTMINGIDCSKMTVKQSEKLISEQVENYKLDVIFMNNETETIKSEDINYEFVSDGSVEKLIKSQSAFGWLPAVMGEKKVYKIDADIKYSDAKLEHVLSMMPQMQDENMTASADAAVQYMDNKFVVVPEVLGNKLDKTKVLETVKAAIAESETSVSIEEQGAYEYPTILSTDTKLVAEVTQLNDLLGAAITYQLPNAETQVLDGQVMKDWLKVSDDGNYSKDDELWNQKIEEYVAELAKKVDTYGLDTTFDASEIGDITIKGDYGFEIDQETEIEQLTEEIANKTITTRKPNYTHEALSYDNNGFGGSYVEIDLSRQRLWMYLDGTAVLNTSIVSGRMTSDRYTPPGIFTLTFKRSPSVLRGEKRSDGTYEYEAPVTFWMPFNGGIGMHDATWRSNSDYGGTTYIKSGSHGCINMKYNDAKTVYENITKEMPIICYYSEPYTVGASTKSSASTTIAPTANTDDDSSSSGSGSGSSGNSGSSGGGSSSSGGNSSGNSGYTEPTQEPVTPAPTQEPTQEPVTPAPTEPPVTEAPTPDESQDSSGSSSAES